MTFLAISSATSSEGTRAAAVDGAAEHSGVGILAPTCSSLLKKLHSERRLKSKSAAMSHALTAKGLVRQLAKGRLPVPPAPGTGRFAISRVSSALRGRVPHARGRGE